MTDPWGVADPVSPPRDDSTALIAVHPPIAWLALAILAVVAAAACLVVAGTPAHVVGYVLSTVVAVGATGAFWLADGNARASTLYAPRSNLGLASACVLVAAVCMAVVHVWFLASRLAR